MIVRADVTFIACKSESFLNKKGDTIQFQTVHFIPNDSDEPMNFVRPFDADKHKPINETFFLEVSPTGRVYFFAGSTIGRNDYYDLDQVKRLNCLESAFTNLVNGINEETNRTRKYLHNHMSGRYVFDVYDDDQAGTCPMHLCWSKHQPWPKAVEYHG